MIRRFVSFIFVLFFDSRPRSKDGVVHWRRYYCQRICWWKRLLRSELDRIENWTLQRPRRVWHQLSRLAAFLGCQVLAVPMFFFLSFLFYLPHATAWFQLHKAPSVLAARLGFLLVQTHVREKESRVELQEIKKKKLIWTRLAFLTFTGATIPAASLLSTSWPYTVSRRGTREKKKNDRPTRWEFPFLCLKIEEGICTVQAEGSFVTSNRDHSNAIHVETKSTPVWKRGGGETTTEGLVAFLFSNRLVVFLILSLSCFLMFWCLIYLSFLRPNPLGVLSTRPCWLRRPTIWRHWLTWPMGTEPTPVTWPVESQVWPSATRWFCFAMYWIHSSFPPANAEMKNREFVRMENVCRLRRRNQHPRSRRFLHRAGHHAGSNGTQGQAAPQLFRLAEWSCHDDHRMGHLVWFNFTDGISGRVNSRLFICWFQAVTGRCPLLGGFQDVGNGKLGSDARTAGHVLLDGDDRSLHPRLRRSPAHFLCCDEETSLPLRWKPLRSPCNSFCYFLQVGYQRFV